MKNKIEKIYENRQNFVVIGLTGKTGSGCSTVAQILKQGYTDYDSPDCKLTNIQNRKASIIKKFASINFKENHKKFKIIKPSTILMMLFLFDNKIIIEKIRAFYKLLDIKDDEIDIYKKEQEYKKELEKEFIELKEIIKILDLLNKKNEIFKDFFNFIKNVKLENKDEIKKNIKNIKKKYKEKLANETEEELKNEIISILGIKKEIKFINYKLEFSKFKELKKESLTQENIEFKINLKREIFHDFLDKYSKKHSGKFIELYEKYDKLIKEKRGSKELTIKNLQLIGDLVREHIDIYQLPTYCNYLIKAYRQETKKNKSSCYIVIDSLKNPFEIVFFKERYSAYYTFSIHSKDEIMKQRLKDLGYNDKEIENIHNREENKDENDKQKGSLDSVKDFKSLNVTECVQRSDIYIDNNNDKKDTLYRQIFKYLSLIVHPGLVTPSNDEIIMQLALTAKLNSGCISRQVGAVILNKHGSVKSIGWNDVPEGQTPCLLRSHSELLDNSISNIYSKYEKTKFREHNKFKYIFSIEKPKEQKYNQYKSSNEKGLNDSFCFKTIQNKIDGDKNQVYTRSLHAEENAFLQASKFGNSEILGGQLFTTASPCFLCAKKAYQLGIKRIVYIEAYPDISNEQVFDIGTHEIEIIHFRGAIGLAYQKLYEPLFPYKDELKALNEVKNK
ncbi:hypothetical protein [Aliarcobacter trophiarum]|uniref:Deoxycytidylate deaminase domain-containing protein n=1 Tax=Aliarcobacter trophiarum LMG 25534 TaxID=1032241 RepID=A0AAD0QIK8_9BACT|nr:hypothetical protein [Aliarcobacter trophiarum]AXK48567.1 deoxycytidylate deaminase domain-containing protein [Aliarcobacter trophiarum LMG 25534]